MDKIQSDLMWCEEQIKSRIISSQSSSDSLLIEYAKLKLEQGRFYVARALRFIEKRTRAVVDGSRAEKFLSLAKESMNKPDLTERQKTQIKWQIDRYERRVLHFKEISHQLELLQCGLLHTS